MTVPSATPFSTARPSALSRFVGRGRELATVAELIAATRLVTLTGAGGSGKTRLALEVLGRVAHLRDAAVWVDLAQVPDRSGAVNQVAAGFGLTERSQAAAVDGIRHLVGDRSILLVLDNCEHVVDVVAVLAETLLRDLPGLSILATSREALGVQGETAWLVPPLGAEEAEELFLDRARAVLPAFPLTPENRLGIAEICRRLDGIPLAIELAAARVRVLSVEQIAARLRDALRLLSGGSRTAPPRHRTLRGTIEWSVGLLVETEQILLRRLAIFPASFTLEAAEAVAADDRLDADQVLDVLSGLVDKSLLLLEANETDARYRLLETVRQFAAERLEATDEAAALARRHAEHYLAVAEAAAPAIFGGAGPARLAELVADTQNFRVAVEWTAGAPERHDLGLRFCWALHWFWWGRGAFEEVHHLRRALAPEISADPNIKVRALIAFCQMGCWQGWLDEAAAFGREAVRLVQGGDDPELEAIALTMAGAALTLTGDLDGALELLDRARVLGVAHSRTNIGGIAHHFTGMCLAARGRLDEAFEAHAAQVAILESFGVGHGRTHARSAQGGIRLDQGRPGEALALFREALSVAARTPDAWGIAKGIEGLALVAADADAPRAVRLLGAAAALRERIAHPMWQDEAARYQGVAESLRASLGDRFESLWSEGRLLSDRAAIAEALAVTLPGMAETAAAGEGTPAGSGRPAPDLVVRALGRLEVVRRGRLVETAEWGSARTRELLLYLLCHPGGVSKERVGTALWPDASPTQLRNNFHVTLHRLRKALGEPGWIVSAGDCYGLDPALTVDFDAAAFDRDVQAGLAAEKRREPRAARLLDGALARYRGPFLEHERVGDWALEHRDRLARLFVDGGLALARRLIDDGRLDDAAELLRTVTRRDPFSEEAWAALMVVHARKGEGTQALRLYLQFESLLAGELEAAPGEAIGGIRTRIQRGEPV